MAKFDANDELRRRIAQARKKQDGSVIFVLGSGVAKGASGGAGAADWGGLLAWGLSACDALMAKGALKVSATWDSVELRRRLESKSADDLVAVASAVEEALRASGGYGRWLKDSVGALPLTSREVLDALAEVKLPIATCNYDGLVEKALERPAITWRDHPMVLEFLRGRDGVLHLHGHYNEPDSVVLGVESYSKLIKSGHAQAVQRALFLERTLVFVGFGAGLEDPNLGALLQWAGQVVPGADCFHVRLCRDSEVGTLMAAHPLTQRIHVLGYGPDHKDLAPYLRSLIHKRVTKGPTVSSGTGGPSSGSAGGTTGPAVRVSFPITISFVREKLNRFLITSADFDAFCIDHFSEIYRRFTDGMERVERTNLLLSIASPEQVYEKLFAHVPSLSFNAHASSGDPPPPRPPAPDILRPVTDPGPSEAPPGTDPPPPPSQPHKIKELLLRVLPTPSDLHVFCQNYFAKAQTHFSASMDRTQRTDFLLDHAAPDEIISALAEMNPERFARYRHLLT